MSRRNRGGKQNRGRNRSNGRGGNSSRNAKNRDGNDGVGFWGSAAALPEPRTDARITQDPHAVPRSLGQPPLPGHEAVAEHYFAAVYDKAVSLAGALATVGGLVAPDELAGDEDD